MNRRALIAAAVTVLVFAALGFLAGREGQQTADPKAPAATGVVSSPQNPLWPHWQSFQKNLDASSQISMTYLLQGETGTDADHLGALQDGRLQVASLHAHTLTTLVPALSLLMSPFLFTDDAEADLVLDKYVLPVLRARFAAEDLALLHVIDGGWTHMFGTAPMAKPESVAGKRLYAEDQASTRVFLDAASATLVSMPTAAVAEALAQGQIDGGVASLSFFDQGLEGQAPVLTLTGHAKDLRFLVADLDWYRSLKQGQRRALLTAFAGTKAVRASMRTWTTAYLHDVAARGAIVRRLTAEERAAWFAATEDALERLARALPSENDAAAMLTAIAAGKLAYASSLIPAPTDVP